MKQSLLLLPTVVIGCATLGSDAGDGEAVRPNARAGPFRELAASEIASGTGIAPYVLPRDDDRRFRDPAVVTPAEHGADPDHVALYVTAELATGSGIFRFVAADARSFSPQPSPSHAVLVAEQTWEGGSVGEPSVVWIGNEMWLAYAAAGGIGLARSSDGVTFERELEPVLSRDAAPAWEADEPPQGPALLVVAPNDFRLFYHAAGSIGEAASTDGRRWVRSGAKPILTRSDTNAFDASSVTAPHALLHRTALGRLTTRVYYAGTDAHGTSVIGLAARFGLDGPLDRATAPVFSASENPRSPSVLVLPSFSLLYVTQKAGVTRTLDFEAVAAAVTPGDLSLSVR